MQLAKLLRTSAPLCPTSVPEQGSTLQGIKWGGPEPKAKSEASPTGTPWDSERAHERDSEHTSCEPTGEHELVLILKVPSSDKNSILLLLLLLSATIQSSSSLSPTSTTLSRVLPWEGKEVCRTSPAGSAGASTYPSLPERLVALNDFTRSHASLSTLDQ